MCGIWALFSNYKLSTDFIDLCHKKLVPTMKFRGPDAFNCLNVPFCGDAFLAFFRLSIMDLSDNGMQPFVQTFDNGHTIYSICNGELYGYHKIKKKYNISTNSDSDCEIIGPLFNQFGMEKMMNILVGSECAIILVDTWIEHDVLKYKLWVSNDRFGVRPLFFGINDDSDNKTVVFSSQLQGLAQNGQQYFKTIQRFPPRFIFGWDGVNDFQWTQYYSVDYPLINVDYTDEQVNILMNDVVQVLELAVTERLNSDRIIACLLSGGLDSSAVAALAAKHLAKKNIKLRTFSLGMPGATDKKYAEIVAKYIGSIHTHIELSEQQFLDKIKIIPQLCGSFDTTTVRATTGQVLMAQAIVKMNITDIEPHLLENITSPQQLNLLQRPVVILIGDGSDEITSGYMYNHYAPSSTELHHEALKRIRDIHLFDGLRADRGTCYSDFPNTSNIVSAEARLPFLDNRFVETYMKINPEWRMPKFGYEKWFLREALNRHHLLPSEILFRPKEAFSDGVSGTCRSWYSIIQEYADTIFSDEQLKSAQSRISHCPPQTKEDLYYRTLFEQEYGTGNVCETIPYFWKHNWINVSDPSARQLTIYRSDLDGGADDIKPT